MNQRRRGSTSVRQRNLDLVLSHLPTGLELSQKEIAEATGFSEATVSNLTAVLVEQGRIEVTAGRRNGRRANLLSRAAPSRGVMIGASISRHRIEVLGIMPDGEVVRTPTIERVAPFEYADDLRRIVDAVEELSLEVPVSSIGVGLGLTVDPVSERVGSVVSSGPEVVPGFSSSWQPADLRSDLAERFGVPTTVLNDADAGVLGELRAGAAVGSQDVLYIQLGDGVGGGLVFGGRLYRGGRGGFSGEIGHLSFDSEGPLCICGNRGCLEPLFGEALLAKVEGVHGRMSIREFARLAGAGDPACSKALRELASPLSRSLANPVALLAPERVVVGGDLSIAGEAMLAPVIEASHAFGWAWRGEIVLAELGQDSVCIGAAYAAADAAMRD
ncbi:ROK family transcriptional regulator [Homoserinibacter sp. GY 40078]|uniref:ROK family transcriptional regulator n=1 Tax=Homoserinibacter sp. GY 40078 TaxID=2603275 RepID=UPI0011C8EA46|nr:ROK family transcriptional regulator [Homoserinibacter sp. GY 40078]TXK19304.1 ROK family transcriptional regulator [Homoserinibacter sp. GY 40078]